MFNGINTNDVVDGQYNPSPAYIKSDEADPSCAKLEIPARNWLPQLAGALVAILLCSAAILCVLSVFFAV